MKTIISSLLLAVSVISFGQNLDRDVVSAAGDHYESNNASLSWTLGEVATESFTSTTIILNQGFHQGNLFISSIEDELDLDVNLKAYPNPVMDILIVESEDPGFEYRLINIQGRVISNGFIHSSSEEIDFTNLPSGTYFLQVEKHKTHKIIKH